MLEVTLELLCICDPTKVYDWPSRDFAWNNKIACEPSGDCLQYYLLPQEGVVHQQTSVLVFESGLADSRPGEAPDSVRSVPAFTLWGGSAPSAVSLTYKYRTQHRLLSLVPQCNSKMKVNEPPQPYCCYYGLAVKQELFGGCGLQDLPELPCHCCVYTLALLIFHKASFLIMVWVWIWKIPQQGSKLHLSEQLMSDVISSRAKHCIQTEAVL